MTLLDQGEPFSFCESDTPPPEGVELWEHARYADENLPKDLTLMVFDTRRPGLWMYFQEKVNEPGRKDMIKTTFWHVPT